MPVSAATLAKLMEAGLAGQALLDVVASIDSDMQAAAPVPAKSARQEANARYYRKKHPRLNSDLNLDTESVLNSDNLQKERSPTPPKEKYYSHSTPPEPSDGQRFVQAIRDVYAIAGQAAPDMSLANSWRKAGWPIEIVCEVIRARLAANPTKNYGLSYFANAIADAVARANAPVPIGVANQRAGPASREKPPSLATQILQRAAQNERNRTESQPIVIDAFPVARGAG